MVKNTDDSFILLPEILTWIGRTELLLNNPKNAGEAFAKARMVKPDYWPAYTRWAEYLQAKGFKKEALEIVRAGLQHAPEAKALNTLYRDLGGKPGDIPPPIVKVEPVPPPETATTDKTEQPTVPVTPSTEQRPE